MGVYDMLTLMEHSIKRIGAKKCIGQASNFLIESASGKACRL